MPKDDSIQFLTFNEQGKKTFMLRSNRIYTNYFSEMYRRDMIE